MNEENNSIVERSGTVIFLKTNIGSKSEAITPVLYETRDFCIPIMLKDDNPFENKGLVGYDGRFVTVRGFLGRDGETLIISKIIPIEKQAASSDEPASETSGKTSDIAASAKVEEKSGGASQPGMLSADEAASADVEELK